MSAEQNLVSVETQSEYSVTTGRRETRIFVKMYVDAAISGLIADMGADRWQTLCVLASFMDAKGECTVTQDVIGEALNISRQSANSRIQRLLKYRFSGQPIIEKRRKKCPVTGQFETYQYVLLPASGLVIGKEAVS